MLDLSNVDPTLIIEARNTFREFAGVISVLLIVYWGFRYKPWYKGK